MPAPSSKSGKVSRTSALVLAAFAWVSGSGAGDDTSTWPRLPSLWSHPPMRNFQSTENPASIRAGVFLGLDPAPILKGGETDDMVALDLELGKVLWRAPYPGTNGIGWVFAGDLVLVRARDGQGTIALELRTGRRRWTRKLPGFNRNLETWRGAHREIGWGSVHGMEWRDSQGGPGQRALLAVDLRTGDSLWQVDCKRGGCIAVPGREAIHLATRSGKDISWRLAALDPESGTVGKSRPVPIRILKSMHVFGPRSERAVLVGDNTLALSLADGRILWQMPPEVMSSESGDPDLARKSPSYRPYEVFKPREPPRSVWRGERLFLIEIGRPHVGNRIREVNLETGRQIAVFDLPAGLRADFDRMHILAGPGTEGLTLIQQPISGDAVAVRFENSEAKPRLFVAGTRIIDAQDRMVVAYAKEKATYRVEGYSAFGPSPRQGSSHPHPPQPAPGP